MHPPNYGHWWNGPECTLQWYNQIWHGRASLHAEMAKRFEALVMSNKVGSVLEVGCGMNGFYPVLFHFLRDRYGRPSYTGIDISAKAIGHCKQALPGTFLTCTPEDMNMSDKFDLVFSHAVIDHVPNIDSFLTSLAGLTSKILVVTSYSGWFDEPRHVQTWCESQGCFFNHIGAPLVRSLLSKVFPSVQVAPLAVQGKQANETLILAER